MKFEKIQNIIVYGTGKYALYLLEKLKDIRWEGKILFFTDSDSLKWGNKFEQYSIVNPKLILQAEYDYIIIATCEWKIVYDLLIKTYHVDSSKIDNVFFDYRENFLNYYTTQKNLDYEQKKILMWVKKKPLDIFNYEFTNKYNYMNIESAYDESCGLFFCMLQGRPLYLAKKYDTKLKAERYFRSLLMEQDEQSPHRYIMNKSDIKDGDVVLDAGVAEGNFALSIIDKISEIYLVEADEMWIEPLQHTFFQYLEKVHIIHRFLSDNENEKEITIDKIIGNKKLNFIKMDIEGAETNALMGGKETFKRNNLKAAICTYHNEKDYEEIRHTIDGFGYNSHPSNGYMIYLSLEKAAWNNTPKYVRGLIRVYKNNTNSIKIILFGTGKKYNIVRNSIDNYACTIVGIIDKKLSENQYEGLTVLNLNDIAKYDYDYIIITSSAYTKEMSDELVNFGVDEEKIIEYWNTKKEYTFLNFQNAKLEREEMQKRKEDNKKYEKKNSDNIPNVHSAIELLEKIRDRHSSLVRFGDGEFEMMRMQNRAWFQTVNQNLADRLFQVLQSHDDRVIVAIADNFGDLDKYEEDAADSIRQYMQNGTRQAIEKMLETGRIYYDAYVTRPYIIYKDKEYSTKIFELFKQIFQNRKILVVEGKNGRMGYNNDLFVGAKEVKRIQCPEKDAYKKYDEIMNITKNNCKNNSLVLISLGSCATVLAYDLAMMGIQAIDIGQLDNEYDWYVSKSKWRTKILGKCVAERSDNHNPDIAPSSDYLSQIISTIG